MRNADRRDDPRRRRGNGPGPSNNDKKSDKKFDSKTEMKDKKMLKVKSTDDYASESDLSVHEEVTTVQEKRGKSPRGAAAKARSRLQKTKATESDLSVDEEGTTPQKRGKSPQGAAAKARSRLLPSKVAKGGRHDSGSDDDYSVKSEEESSSDFEADKSSVRSRDDSSSDEVDPVVRGAKARQAKALQRAQAGKKIFGEKGKADSKKKFAKKNTGRKAMAKKGKKKGGDDPSDDSGSSSDESTNPEDNIDMDALVAEAMAGAQMSNLHSISWWRIVLDEAHFIKSRNSQTSHAAFALTGIHRWCLSGTPLQNRVGEFYSLIRFLRLDPMAHYICRSKVSPVDYFLRIQTF